MISKHKSTGYDLLRQYIRISSYEDIERTPSEKKMKWQEEEVLIENFHMSVLTLSSAEVVALAERARDIAHEEFKNHPEKGRITLRILVEILGDRYPSKYLKKHPTIVMSNPREVIEYSAEEEKALKSLILSLKEDIRETDYFRIDALMEHVTGEQTHFMNAVWEK